MDLRSTTTTVMFRRDFSLPGHDAPFPAGTYEVLCEDERIDGLTFEAFRRVATFLRSTGVGMLADTAELKWIAPEDLAAALRADQAGEPGGKSGT